MHFLFPSFTLFGFLWILVWHPGVVGAQSEALDQSTPRKTWNLFSQACWDQDYELAEQILRPRKDEDTKVLARKFCEVTNHLLRITPEQLSDEPEGKKGADSFDIHGDVTEPVGQILGTSGFEDVVRLRLRKDTKQWFFHPQTVAGIERWYGMLDGQWFRNHLPAFLQRSGPFNLSLWQWVVLPSMLLLAYVFAFALVILLRLCSRPFLKADHPLWNQDLPNRLKRPLRVLLAALLAQGALPFLYLNLRVEEVISGMLHLVSCWAGISTLVRMVRLVGDHTNSSVWIKLHPTAKNLIPLGLRGAKILLILIGLALSLRVLGYSITSLVAGLGIGGLAVALAAQKTVEQVFGGIVLSVDQPMRVGDLIKVGDLTGTVEYMGLRSTRIRTPERTVVTIPNGKLADMNIESYTVRDRIRSSNVLKLEYTTKLEQIQALLTEITEFLQNYPKIWPHDIQVFLKALGEHSFEVEITFWLQTTDLPDFVMMRQEILLQIIQRVEKQGAVIASHAKAIWIGTTPNVT